MYRSDHCRCRLTKTDSIHVKTFCHTKVNQFDPSIWDNHYVWALYISFRFFNKINKSWIVMFSYIKRRSILPVFKVSFWIKPFMISAIFITSCIGKPDIITCIGYGKTYRLIPLIDEKIIGWIDQAMEKNDCRSNCILLWIVWSHSKNCIQVTIVSLYLKFTYFKALILNYLFCW